MQNVAAKFLVLWAFVGGTFVQGQINVGLSKVQVPSQFSCSGPLLSFIFFHESLSSFLCRAQII